MTIAFIETLKDKKSLFRIVTQRLNDTKAEIDDFKAKIEKKQIENAHCKYSMNICRIKSA